MGDKVSPHKFVPFMFWDKFFARGRCIQCMSPRCDHYYASPVGRLNFWATARGLWDKAPAESPIFVFPNEKL